MSKYDMRIVGKLETLWAFRAFGSKRNNNILINSNNIVIIVLHMNLFCNHNV
jgi:hypothetical protein